MFPGTKSGFCALPGYVASHRQSIDFPRRPSKAAAHSARAVESAHLCSPYGNGGCHVGAFLPQTSDGRSDHGLLAWVSDRALRDRPVRTGVLGPQRYSGVPILTEFGEFTAARHADSVDRAEMLLNAFVVDWLSARRLDRPADARCRDRNFVRCTV